MELLMLVEVAVGVTTLDERSAAFESISRISSMAFGVEVFG